MKPGVRRQVAKDVNHAKEAQQLVSQTCRQAIDNNQREALLDSQSGVRLLKLELENLFAKVEQLLQKGKHQLEDHHIDVVFEERACLLRGERYTAQLLLYSKYKNTVKNSVLYLRLWKGKLLRGKRRRVAFFKPKLITQRSFSFDMDCRGKRQWQEKEKSNRCFTSAELAEVFVASLRSV